jgi:hypothetical protein
VGGPDAGGREVADPDVGGPGVGGPDVGGPDVGGPYVVLVSGTTRGSARRWLVGPGDGVDGEIAVSVSGTVAGL